MANDGRLRLKLLELEEIRTYLMNEVDNVHRCYHQAQTFRLRLQPLPSHLETLAKVITSLREEVAGGLKQAGDWVQLQVLTLADNYGNKLREKDQQIVRLNQELARVKDNYLQIQKQVDQIIREDNNQKVVAARRLKELQEKLVGCKCRGSSLPPELQPIREMDQDSPREQSTTAVTEQHRVSIQTLEDSRQSQLDFPPVGPGGKVLTELVEDRAEKHWGAIRPEEKKGKFIRLEERAVKRSSLNKSILEQLGAKRRSSWDEERLKQNRRITIKISLGKQKPSHPRPEEVIGLSSFQLAEVRYEGEGREGRGRGLAWYEGGLSYSGQFERGLRHGFGYVPHQSAEKGRGLGLQRRVGGGLLLGRGENDQPAQHRGQAGPGRRDLVPLDALQRGLPEEHVPRQGQPGAGQRTPVPGQLRGGGGPGRGLAREEGRHHPARGMGQKPVEPANMKLLQYRYRQFLQSYLAPLYSLSSSHLAPRRSSCWASSSPALSLFAPLTSLAHELPLLNHRLSSSPWNYRSLLSSAEWISFSYLRKSSCSLTRLAACLPFRLQSMATLSWWKEMLPPDYYTRRASSRQLWQPRACSSPGGRGRGTLNERVDLRRICL